MKLKKESFVYSIVIGILIISIAYVAINIMQGKAKEYDEAKRIMALLQDNNAIDSSFDIMNSEYEVLKENKKEKGYIRYTIMTGDYGIDLNEEYNLVGFQNKKVTLDSEKSLSEEDAKMLALKYINLLTDDNLIFTQVKNNTSDEDNLYTVTFSKTRDDYSIFGQEALIKINKSTGLLEGYNNIPLKNVKYDSEIKVDKEEAKNVAIGYFEKMDVRIERLEEPTESYFLIGNDKAKLCYIFETELVDKDNVTHKYKIFISTKTGEIINTLDDTINKAKAI